MKNKIIQIIIGFVFILVIGVGLLVWGIMSGIGFIKNSVNPMLSDTKTVSASKNKIETSPTSYGFKTLSSYNILVASITTSEEVKSKQKIILINPGVFFTITKQDIESNNIESQLKNLTSIGPVQIINFDKFKIVNKSSFKVAQQNVPYVKGNFGILTGSTVPSEGIVGVIDTANSTNNIFISIADSGKFKIKTVEDFFKKTAERTN